MADSFVPITFVADELLTSTKMNLLAANQAGFHDGTALGDGIIVTRHLALTSVEGKNIRFGTFGSKRARTDNTLAITGSGTQPVPGLSITVDTPGDYYVSASGNAQQQDGADSYPRIGIYVNGSRLAYSALKVYNTNQLSWQCADIISLSVGDVVSVQVVGAPVSLFEGNGLVMLRV